MSELDSSLLRPTIGVADPFGALFTPQDASDRNWFDMAAYFRLRAKRVPIKKALTFARDVLRHWKAMLPLLRAPAGSNLHRLVNAYPEILFTASGPYLAQNWNARQRLARIVDHCETVAVIGGIVDFPPTSTRDLCRLTPIDSRYRLVLHQPREFIWEGQLDLSLYDNNHRIFSLRFCLSSEGGPRIAHIGALQGRPQKEGEPNILDTYSFFSKTAARMRPRDFMIEAFQMLSRALGVAEIRAVADHNKPRRCFERSYDEVWREHGGEYNGNGFFILPVRAKRRAEEEMPAKKKTMYRKRYAMLNEIEARIAVMQPSNAPRFHPILSLQAA